MPIVTVNIPQTTFVASGQPDMNFSTDPLLNVGTDSILESCTGLLQIPLPQLSVSAVYGATLNLAVIIKSGTELSPLLVNRITSSFNTDTVTYTSQSAFVPTQSLYNVTTSDLYTLIHIDITDLVNEWLSGVSPNYGIALTNQDGVTEVRFATNNIIYQPYFPTLTVHFSDPAVLNTGTNFLYNQLAHIIEQIVQLYPSSTVTVFTKGLTASSITGTPYELYKSSTGTSGALFVLMDAGQQEIIPLSAIAAIYTGQGTVYNPSIAYLAPPQEFTPGFDANLITAYYEYLSTVTGVTVYAGSNITASGSIYKNEYGIIVLSDSAGNTPVFVPLNNITAVLPDLPAGRLQGIEKPGVSAEPCS